MGLIGGDKMRVAVDSMKVLGRQGSVLQPGTTHIAKGAMGAPPAGFSHGYF